MIFACRQLFPRKGIRFLLEAAAQLKPQFPDLQVVLAGDGFERPALVQLAEDLGIAAKVTFLGWVANTGSTPVYRAAAVSVLPHWRRGSAFPPPRRWAARYRWWRATPAGSRGGRGRCHRPGRSPRRFRGA